MTYDITSLPWCNVIDDYRLVFIVSLSLFRKILNARQKLNIHRVGDSDVISFRIYASWFSPPSCG